MNIRKKITNARGQIRQVFHDAMGRITGYTSPEGAVSYTYDANGNVLTVTDSHGTITRTYDALNRIASYTDTYGKMIRYEYDAVGNLSKLIYPDNTAVTYAYDANHNLIRVTDWANRMTAYTYDANNRIVGVTKPDGSVTTTIYDNMQRVTSTVVRAMSGAVIGRVGAKTYVDGYCGAVMIYGMLYETAPNTAAIGASYCSVSKELAQQVEDITMEFIRPYFE